MDVLEILPYSGPLSVEDMLWRAGGNPADALKQVLRLADQKLVSLSGIAPGKLRDLLRQIQQVPTEDVDGARSTIHDWLGKTDATIELTSEGLRFAPKTV
jgi:hypothetical protein